MPIATRALSKNPFARIKRYFGLLKAQEGQSSIVPPVNGQTGAASWLSYLIPFDYVLLAGMWALTVPVFWMARVPYSFDLPALTAAYWLMPVGAIFVSVVLAALGLPFSETIQPFLRRLRSSKGMAALLLVAAVILCVDMGSLGIVVFVDAVALVELWQRCGKGFGARVRGLLISSVYLFIGLIAVFAFNHAIVAIRYGGMSDAVLSRLDYKIFDASVPAIAHWGSHHLPAWMLQVLNFVYFSIWSRFGAALVIVGVLGQRKEAVQFARNILVCYVLALMAFAAVPGKGPYSTFKVHVLPSDLGSYSTQQLLTERIKKLYAHTLTEDVRRVGIGDYYIGFPSLHAALPIIAIWFLRRWRRVQAISAFVYFGLLLPALIFLDWHYLVDIVGGWAVAVLSIWTTEAISRGSGVSRREHPSVEPAAV